MSYWLIKGHENAFNVISAKAGIQVITREWIPDYYLGNDDLIVFSGQ